MAEPTLLQQAGQYIRDAARALAEQPTCTPFERGILFAATSLHMHIEQREAAKRGPAQVPGTEGTERRLIGKWLVRSDAVAPTPMPDEQVWRQELVRGPDGYAALVAKAEPAPTADDDLTALEKLCAAATPGPWCTQVLSLVAYSREPGLERRAVDLRLVDAARDALPKLIAEVRRLRHAATAPVCVLCIDKRSGTHCADCRGKLWQDSDGDYHSEEAEHG